MDSDMLPISRLFAGQVVTQMSNSNELVKFMVKLVTLFNLKISKEMAELTSNKNSSIFLSII